MVPNLKYVVQAVRDSKPWPFHTKEQLCAYSHAVLVALHAADPNFGKLKKAITQNYCVDPSGQPGAVDVALYRPTGQVVDFITSAGYGTPPPQNTVTWLVGPEGEYGPGAWFAPGEITPGPEPLPQPTPAPPPPVDLEPRVASLEQRMTNLEKNILARLEWLETGQTGPDYRSEPTPAEGRVFGYRIPITVGAITSRPVRKE